MREFLFAVGCHPKHRWIRRICQLPAVNCGLKGTAFPLFMNNKLSRFWPGSHMGDMSRALSHSYCVKRFSHHHCHNSDLALTLSLQKSVRLYCSGPHDKDVKKMDDKNAEPKKLSVFKRFKQMYTDYWYVLIPVHVATSVVWYGSFYYIAKSGIDVVPLLESIGLGDTLINPLRNSNAGYFAVAYAMYKIATPARYTVTLGGTTISIKYLRDWGYLTPIPEIKENWKGKKDDIKETVMEKKNNLMDTYQETRDELKHIVQEKRENILELYQDKKEKFKGKYSEKKENLIEQYREKRKDLKGIAAEKKDSIEDTVKK